MDGLEKALLLLPSELRAETARTLERERDRCEQIHLRAGHSPCARLGDRDVTVDAPPVTEKQLRYVLERASGGSFQTAESQSARGFLCASGGVRVGLCGTAVIRDGRVTGLRDLSSVCIRVPCEKRGCADGIYPALSRPRFLSTLLFSPPAAGKTTLLRELVRRLSGDGVTVSVADERGEIAGMSEGANGFDLGDHADVMSGMPKSEAALMLIRSMAPQVLAMDEIGGRADAEALTEAVGCGVALLTSVHAASEKELRQKPYMRELLEAGAFRRLVCIRNEHGIRRYEVTEL